MGERKKCVATGRHASRPTSQRYRASDRLRKRRIARIERHIRAHPNDKQAPDDLKRIEVAIYVRPTEADAMALPGTPAAAKGRKR